MPRSYRARAHAPSANPLIEREQTMAAYPPSYRQEIPTHLSWFVIIISFLLCWPIGLVLLALRLKHDKSSQMVAGHAMVIIGVVVVCFFGLGLIATFADKTAPPGTTMVCLVFLAGGLALIYKGRTSKKRASAVRRYIDLIVNQNQTSVDSIASMTGRTDIPAVTAEIHDLINSGFLRGFTLDPETRMVSRVGGAAPAASPVMVSASAQSRAATFKCKSCGANNTAAAVVNGVAVCEYCESANSV